MSDANKLFLIKIVHTLVWIFFNLVIGYMIYAVIVNRIDTLLWFCYALIVAEGIVLLICRLYCPLTILARRYSNSEKQNFDIYLPEWLARNNKRIYTVIVLLIAIFTVIRLLE